MAMPFGLRIIIRYRCTDELRGTFRSLPSKPRDHRVLCLESGLPAKRTKKLLATPLVDKNKTLKSCLF